MVEERETIAAIATPIGEGAIAIVRLSGGDAVRIADSVFRGRKGLAHAASHSLVHGRIITPAGDVVDDVLVGVMRGPHTYTGEDVVEVNCHGGRLVVEHVFKRLLSAGARPAERGEYTKRAFLNGRLDLAQAEAVIDVVRARSPRGLEVAARQLEGALSNRVTQVREIVLNLMAHLQVAIDYPEEDVAELSGEEVGQRIAQGIGLVEELLEGSEAGRVYSEGIKVAIVGRPNVGKSSLLNALLQEERAIVTEVAGTTRDTIEESAVLGGMPFTLTDTAGLRATSDPVERLGVERTREALRGADLALMLFDGSTSIQAEDREVMLAVEELKEDRAVVAVINKADLPQMLTREDLAGLSYPLIAVSARTGEGLGLLQEEAVKAVLGSEPPSRDAVLVARARHRQSLERGLRSLRSAAETLQNGLPPDLLTVDLQEALDNLGEITGESVSDQVVARIFAQFCVGK